MSDPWDALGGSQRIDLRGIETEITTSSGEVVELHPLIALVRHGFVEQHAAERAAYCERHNIDPTRKMVCPECEGTGFSKQHDWPCYCEMGRSQLRFIAKRQHDQSEALRRRVEGDQSELDPEWARRDK